METHSCDPSAHISSVASSASFVARANELRIKTNPNMKPKEIQNLMRAEGQVVTYISSWRGREKVRRQLFIDSAVSFAKINSFCSTIINYGGYSDFCVTTGNRFEAVFICPAPAIKAFPYFRQVVVLDAAFLKTEHKGYLMAASTIDANSQLFILAFAIAEIENTENWTWFLDSFKIAMNLNSDDAEITFVSDRQKGLINAVSTVFPFAAHSYCGRHIYGNLKSVCSNIEIEKLFWQALKASTEAEFNEVLNEIGIISPTAEEYLKQINTANWSSWNFGGKRYGITTNNLSESLNSLFLEAREKDHLYVLLDIYNWSMIKNYERKNQSQSINGIIYFKIRAPSNCCI